MELKAYGHPGITLHRTTGEEASLCDSCTYHEDDTCTFPKRPYAKECTLYQNRALKDLYQKPQQKSSPSIRLWLQRNLIWLVLVGLIVVSFILALMR
ncbi:hypothetical protein MiSe_34920 [Microseira wollei NIES-4236]|uniref:Uncharacterized protein n=2 Tax=Microseira wollei TaxID=467598 RepID=A0AAV3X990_9CYAN|nr:hypothetical protein MiSe_34920 [Microseira wollei NIES-4236]